MSTTRSKIVITKNEGWAEMFWEALIPLKDKVAQHDVFKKMASGDIPIDVFRKGLIGFYPLVENFPKYMGLALSKVDTEAPRGHEQAKHWLIENIRVEQKHGEWWTDWACGFGVTLDELKSSRPEPLMNAINNYLWTTNTYGSLHEGISATNIAIEWATGEWCKSVMQGVKLYFDKGIAQENDRKTTAWLRAHTMYDDLHPYEAMEIIKLLCADSEAKRNKAFAAAKQGFEYYLIALDSWSAEIR